MSLLDKKDQEQSTIEDFPENQTDELIKDSTITEIKTTDM